MKQKENVLKSQLQNFGFTDKESAVYISLLELGNSSVTLISRKAGINRTTCYDILSSLSNKGLISISGKEPKQEYIAESPTKIIEYHKKIAREASEQAKLIEETLVPELTLLHSVKNRPKIRFYEGNEGLRHAYEDTLTSSGMIFAYATVDDMYTNIPGLFPDYFKRRAAKKIFARAIIPKTALGIERKMQDKNEMRETALIPPDKYYFSPEINIYDNKVMIASWREKLGIIIESEEIADAMKKIYELAWAEAKRLDKKSE
jgi:sugar-specific transcriptional regulator TrmB